MAEVDYSYLYGELDLFGPTRNVNMYFIKYMKRYRKYETENRLYRVNHHMNKAYHNTPSNSFYYLIREDIYQGLLVADLDPIERFTETSILRVHLTSRVHLTYSIKKFWTYRICSHNGIERQTGTKTFLKSFIENNPNIETYA